MKYINIFLTIAVLIMLKYLSEPIITPTWHCVILFNSLFTGVGQSIQPIIATNYGAGKYTHIKKVRTMAFATIILIGIIFSLSGILFPTGVCSVFMNPNDEMKVIANLGVRIYFITFFPMGLNLLTSYYLQSVLSVKESLCISLLRNVILSSISIIVFPLLFGKNSLWMVMPVVEFFVLLFSLIFLRVSDTKKGTCLFKCPDV